MTKEIVHVEGMSEASKRANIPLSTAVKAGIRFRLRPASHGPGDRATCPGDIVRQTETCLENLKAAVEAAGSSLDKV